MKPGLKKEFTERWQKYFPDSELPITFYYRDKTGKIPVHKVVEGRHCFIEDLQAVRQGQPLCFNTKSVACFGGKRYLGFSQKLMPDFDYFLSCGIPGKLEGERYKTLANFDEPTHEAVFCPMGAGCATIIQYPLIECRSDRPRAVIGMFDVSARPSVNATYLTFSVPMQKFERMVANMDESFLTTGSWDKIRGRLNTHQNV
jgi:hypothetical protein